ncbi:OOP family OmpA-OmpF porin [Rhodobium orientis]|uniref:OmpA-like domain-containing protein n=1 Tax=Rhodobium orientis TaxID=34017 RepID=A0A327JNT7_9HYPH|nr:OmpA family protein [Rhodobium orientis]MBB4305145.1 OOP family OmpA-OmpF porin [Rhodobium orientis]MBK5950919.1 hypothetical protein [Rhodobium orientis]RAI27033.1 hypothetical protein CH339_11895 [Rhodobium orientis]
MANPWKLALVGIGAAALLTALGDLVLLRDVEQDLTARAKSRLMQDAQAWADVSLSGRDATLTGTAPSKEALLLALKSVDRVWGVRIVIDKTDILPGQSPYPLTLTRKEDALSVSGYVPRRGARDGILEDVRKIFADEKLTYDLPLASGAPPGLDNAARFGLDLLKDMTAGEVAIRDRAVTVSGTAATAGTYERLLRTLKTELPLGYTLERTDVLAPPAKPYLWSAKKTGEAVVLEGYVGSKEEREAIVKKSESALRGASLDDTTGYASGAPDGFDGFVAFALDRLSVLDHGTVSLTDTTLSISGEAKTIPEHEALLKALTSELPDGLTLGTVDLLRPLPPLPESDADLAEVPPATWIARRTKDTLILAGAIPDAATKEPLGELVSQRFGAVPVIDRQRPGEGMPERFLDAAGAGLNALARLGEGQIEIRADELTLSGAAYHAAAAESVRDRLLSELPAGFSGNFNDLRIRAPGTPVSASRCQQLFSSILRGNRIRFETGSTRIDRDSFGILDHLVFVAQRCPQSRVVIEGHTDSDGSEADNLRLSDWRAAAVVDYLVRAGVDADRLEAVGFGEDRPVASNDTEEGKALNRRIEFRIVPE